MKTCSTWQPSWLKLFSLFSYLYTGCLTLNECRASRYIIDGKIAYYTGNQFGICNGIRRKSGFKWSTKTSADINHESSIKIDILIHLHFKSSHKIFQKIIRFFLYYHYRYKSVFFV